VDIRGVYEVAVSPNGKSVYVGSSSSHAVARFNRNTTKWTFGRSSKVTG
jgi:DNA-binding beta-propeller fold protein YncE